MLYARQRFPMDQIKKKWYLGTRRIEIYQNRLVPKIYEKSDKQNSILEVKVIILCHSLQ